MPGKTETEIRRMMQEFDHQISKMNSEVITEIAGDIKKTDFLQLANAISILRAKYLRDILTMAHADKENLNHQLCSDVRATRIAYEEAIESFNQLKHALERGYFNLIED